MSGRTAEQAHTGLPGVPIEDIPNGVDVAAFAIGAGAGAPVRTALGLDAHDRSWTA